MYIIERMIFHIIIYLIGFSYNLYEARLNKLILVIVNKGSKIL